MDALQSLGSGMLSYFTNVQHPVFILAAKSISGSTSSSSSTLAKPSRPGRSKVPSPPPPPDGATTGLAITEKRRRLSRRNSEQDDLGTEAGESDSAFDRLEELRDTDSYTTSPNMNLSRPITPAEQILSEAFSPRLDASSAVSRSSLLEGGSQLSHDRSRTAEGAVRSMYDQRQLAEEKREDERMREDEMKERRSSWSSLIGSKEEGTRSNESLKDLLSPIWANESYRELVKGTEDDEISLLAMLGRADAQNLLGLLLEAVSDSPSSSTSLSPSTATLSLRFPINSVHYRASQSFRSNSRRPSTASHSLEIVATFQPAQHLIIVTTVLHTVQQSSPARPLSSTAPPSTTRPPLNPQISGLSALSASSSSTAVPASPTPFLPVSPPRNGSDSVPSAIPLYTGVPVGEGLPDGLPAPNNFDGFLTERTSRRRRRRSDSSREKSLLSIEAEGEGLAEISEVCSGKETYTEDRDDDVESESESSRPVSSASASIAALAEDSFIGYISTTPMGRMIRDYAWETTPLGVIDTWAPELKTMVSSVLASPFREALWIGEESVLIYNDHYAVLAASKHPYIFGKSGSEGWLELWVTLGPLAAKVMRGETVSYTDHFLPMYLNGFINECYHIWAFIPFRDRDGAVVGYHNPSFETTERVIAERRLATIRDLVATTSLARTSKDFYERALVSLARNDLDLPFVIMYSCEGIALHSTPEAGLKLYEASKTPTPRQLKLFLEGSIGVPSDHPSALPTLTVQVESEPTENGLDRSTISSSSTSPALDSPHGWPLSLVFSSQRPVFVELGDRAKGFIPRGWPEPPRNGVVIPIIFEGSADKISGILIVGLNPRRPWNEVYATFLSLLARQLASGLYSSLSAEQDSIRAGELEALNRAKSSFFVNVSHELRTPLSLILGPLDDVLSSKESNLSTSEKESLVVVQRHANRLLNMVNTLLDFSRLEGGKMGTFRPVRLGSLTADLASLFRSAIERGKIEYVVDCVDDQTSGEPVYLVVEMWEKVVFNLIGNAFKYCLSGKITVRSYFTSDAAIVSVSDTGCGIASNELELIFERFHRVEAASRSAEGTGIGLALTLELVKTLGGTLVVESELGKGSTFTVRLPRGSSHLSHLPPERLSHSEIVDTAVLSSTRAGATLSIIEDAALWQQDAPTTARPESEISVSGQSASTGLPSEHQYLVSAELLNLSDSVILLADDNHDLRRYISGFLSKSFKVLAFVDGVSLLEYALRHPPDLIITDMQMPRIDDGHRLISALRSNSATALIPIICLSANAAPEARIEALLQADDYLTKPFSSKELLARVNIHLQLGKMRMELERRVEERTRALIASEMRYRALADRYSTLSVLSPVGIFLVDHEGLITYANPKWYQISSHSVLEPLQNWRASVFPDDLPRVNNVWQEAIDAGPIGKSFHAEFRWKEGNFVQFEIRGYADEKTGGSGYVGAITDITHQKELEKLHLLTVEQRIADAEESKRQQELFIDMASHELRNPLSGVWQNAEVVSGSLEHINDVLQDMRMGQIPDDAGFEELMSEMEENIDGLESIILCASHQQRIADDILNVSKLNMNLLSINLIPFELAEKVKDVMKMFEIECAQKQINLSVMRGKSLVTLQADWIIADPSRLSQILINFLTNSVKYTADSSRRAVVVHLDAYNLPPPQNVNAMRIAPTEVITPEGCIWIVIGVEDSGKGLTKEEMTKLFARFSQANPRSDQFSGSGLGLYISRELVNLHKGYIEVESKQGEGSTFRFAVPVARAVESTSKFGPGPSLTPIALRKRPPSASAAARSVAQALKKRESTESILSATTPSSTGSESRHSDIGNPFSPLPTPLPSPATLEPEQLHVLVVEDNVINQRVLTRQLKLEKYIVTVVNNGREFLDMIERIESHPDDTVPRISVVLLDIEMPVLSGLEAIIELREKERKGIISRSYPVIAVTGNARQGQVETFLKSGFDSIAIKPYKMVELLASMHEVIARKGSA